jgi:hypothetical protein
LKSSKLGASNRPAGAAEGSVTLTPVTSRIVDTGALQKLANGQELDPRVLAHCEE